jgi:hypothetical protein
LRERIEFVDVLVDGVWRGDRRLFDEHLGD